MLLLLRLLIVQKINLSPCYEHLTHYWGWGSDNKVGNITISRKWHRYPNLKTVQNYTKKEALSKMQSSHLVLNIDIKEGDWKSISDIHTIVLEQKFLRLDKKNYIFENASHSIHDNSIPE